MEISWGWTAGLITAGVLLLDLYSYLTGKPTLSAEIKNVSLKHPLLPYVLGFANGVLAWHFWLMEK